jgi:transposase
MRLSGSVPSASRRTSAGNGGGLSRGDRNRNARLARLRELVPYRNAIVGIDLADDKQAAVVAGHDSRVIARRRVRARAWELGELLDWAAATAAGAGFASVTVACEPTGYRWRVLDQLAAGRGLALVCVQPLLVYRAWEGEDLTRDKSDPKDAVLIAWLASELRCYEPERAGAVWARLRHLGARRRQLITEATAAVNQIRDLAECAWPAVLAASASPFRSVSWCASLAVVLDRCAGDLGRVRRLGLDRFTAAVRRELPRWGGKRLCLRIIRAVFAALADPAGVTAHRPGALERAHLALGDWRDTRARLDATEARMCAVLDELGLTELITTITGLTVTGAAAILAETGDPARFATPRALVKHAGLCPRDNASGAAQGKTSISGRGRPGLRLAAWRAVWAAMPNNPVMAARFAHLTTRQDNRLARQQARTACAAALLRWIHVVVTRRVTWDPAIAAGGTPLRQAA